MLFLKHMRMVCSHRDIIYLPFIYFITTNLQCVSCCSKSVDADKAIKATSHSETMAQILKKKFSEENRTLIDLPEWSQASPEKPDDCKVNHILIKYILAVNEYHITVIDCVSVSTPKRIVQFQMRYYFRYYVKHSDQCCSYTAWFIYYLHFYHRVKFTSTTNYRQPN